MRTVSLAILTAVAAIPALGEEPPLPPADRVPILRLDPGGAAAPVSALAFAPDGHSLFVGGFDKLVRVYSKKAGKWVPGEPLRLPVGPGNAGAVNAVAVSPDGKWLGVAGRSPMRDEAKFGQDGSVVDTKQIPPAMKRDLGTIYLFDLTKPNGNSVIRGMLGEIRALAFATPSPAAGPVVVAAGIEWTDAGERVGTVRAWDAAGKELGKTSDFPNVPTRPGLVAWNADGVKVGVNWPGTDPKKPGKLVIWDVAANSREDLETGSFHYPLALRTEQGTATQLISGSFANFGARDPHGEIAIRPVGNLGKPHPIPLPSQDKLAYLPRALAGAGETLGTLVEIAGGPQSADRPTELRLLAKDGQELGKTPIAGLSRQFLPVLAASPDGKTLAVAGFTDHRVELYDATSLAASKVERTVIPAADPGFTKVAFADGKLWLGTASESPEKGGTVFDPVARTAAANAGKLTADPTTEAKFDWSDATKPNVIAMTLAGQESKFVLRSAQRPTAAVYVPANPKWGKDQPALVAVAHTDFGNAATLVTLFDAGTQEPIRSFVGPETPVTALAVSSTKPLLAAATGSRTAVVWSLKKLDQFSGAVDGLELADAGEGIRVTATPDRDKLPVGAILEAIGGEDGKLTPVKTSAEFLWVLRSRAVGGTVGIGVKGNANRVVLPVGRGIEQHGPLFSLWIGANGTDWVGWNPNGPYDANALASEARIGWLTNTGDPAAPTTFAGADQYRKTYYRKDVLRFLADKGDLALGLDAYTDEYPPPPPKLRLRVGGTVMAANGAILLRDPKAARLDVNLDDVNDDFPLDRAVLRWRATPPGGKPGPWQEIALADKDRTFSLDLSKHGWLRGRHGFEAALHRTPTSPTAATDLADATFVPAAPTLALLVDGKPVAGAAIKTETETAKVTATVTPGPGGPADAVLVWTGHAGETGTLPLKPDAEVKLAPGVTSVRVTAAARDAGEFAIHESATAEVRLAYTPPKIAPPPTVARLEPNVSTESRAVAGKPVEIAAVGKIVLATSIEAEEPIGVLEWDDGDGKWQAAKIAPQKSLIASREIALKPGETRSVRVRAKAGKGDFGSTSLTVGYHPPLPEVRLDPPVESVTANSVVVTGVIAGDGRASVRVTSPAGTSRSVPATVDAAANTWTATVPLEPGANAISLEIANDWRTARLPVAATVAYRRPPRIESVAPVDAGETAVAEVIATVIAPPGVPPTDLLVNGREVDSVSTKKLDETPTEVRWQLTVRDVPVNGRDTLAVVARSAEGTSRPMAVAVKRTPKPPTPPRIAFAEGTADRSTDQARIGVRFRVASGSKLMRVDVRHAAGAGSPLERVAAVDPGPAPKPPEEVALTGSAEVTLRPGVNRIQVVAVNAGGATATGFTVSYTPSAVQILVDALEEIGGIHVKQLDDVYVAQGGYAMVRGRIRWPNADSPVARDPKLHAIMIVNQCELFPVPLDPPTADGRERNFHVPLFLIAHDCTVRIEFRSPSRASAVAIQKVGSPTIRVSTKNPLSQQRLHVVAIGVDIEAKDRALYARQVVSALSGQVPNERFDRGEFTHGAFEQAVMYPPVVGDVDDGKIAWVLDEVGREIKRNAVSKPGGWLNDVILLYYQGRDWTGPDGRQWLHTSRSLRYPPETATRFAVRVDSLPQTPGVRLLVLNVVSPDARPNRDSITERASQMRFAWLDPSGLSKVPKALQTATAENRTLGAVVNALEREMKPNMSQNVHSDVLARIFGHGSR